MKRRFANSFEFDPSKPLVIQYGVYPHKKTGMDQIVDRASAEGFAARIAQARKEGAPGFPIYEGHPDVPELAAKYPNKAAVGWITACSVGDDACELTPQWVGEPPAPGAFIYFSPYFFGEDLPGNKNHIDDMQSIGLTNRPNSTRFRLPNEAADEEQPNERISMNKLLALLGLAATATEDEAAAKVQALLDENAALKRKGEEQAAEVQTANTACATAKKDFANERDERIGLLLDCAMRDGKVTPATKPVWQGRLKRDFPNEAEALSKECAGLKTRSALPNELGDASPSGVLAKYEAMGDGPDKDAFFAAHVVQINDARVAQKK